MPKSGFEKLFQMSWAFQPARVLHAACELDLFDHLEQPRGAKDVARLAKANERAVGILLDALAALGLICKEGGARYRNGPDVSAHLVSTKPDYRGAIFKHIANTWEGWTELTRTVKSGRTAASGGSRPPGEQRSFILGMHAIARDLAPKIAAVLPLPGNGRLLDIGGGPATYCLAFCRARPRILCTLFDRPETLKIAREVIKNEGAEVAGRIKLRAGDFTTDDLGEDKFGFVWLSQVLHAYAEAECAALIRKTHAALKPGGVCAVHEFATNDAKTAPLPAALFSVHMLAVTAGGRAYSRGEIAAWMRQAGFKRIKTRRASPASSLIMGWKR